MLGAELAKEFGRGPGAEQDVREGLHLEWERAGRMRTSRQRERQGCLECTDGRRTAS